MTRVGVIDLGTNSTRLLIADVGNGAVEELDRQITITRLGKGVDETRTLNDAAMERVRGVLVDYRRRIEAADARKVLAIGTSAIRDAENGAAFLRDIESTYSFTARLLSGSEEALMAFRGVASDRDVAASTLLVDVGGGSTELVLGSRQNVSFHASLDLGCVRLTERFLAGDPPTPEELSASAAQVHSLMDTHVPEEVRPAIAIGVAGTVTTLATLHLGLAEEDPELVHRHVLPTAWIIEEVELLSRSSVAELQATPGIHRDRAPVILAGTVVVLEILRYFDLEELEVSERDIMHGAALAAAELPVRRVGTA